jgi:hypothetical protein
MSCLSPAWRSGESRPDEVMVLTFVHRVVEEEIRFVLIKAPQPDDVSERPGIRCRADKMKGNDGLRLAYAKSGWWEELCKE